MSNQNWTHTYTGTPCIVLSHTRRKVAGGTAVDIIYQIGTCRAYATVNAANLKEIEPEHPEHDCVGTEDCPVCHAGLSPEDCC